MGDSFVPLGSGSPAAPAPFRPLGASESALEESMPVEKIDDDGTAEELRRAFQAGYEEAREDLARDSQAIAESLGKALKELARFRTVVRDRYERELLELALGV